MYAKHCSSVANFIEASRMFISNSEINSGTIFYLCQVNNRGRICFFFSTHKQQILRCAQDDTSENSFSAAAKAADDKKPNWIIL
jgi:hypothetical protein